MAKLITMFMILIALQACILIYQDSSQMDNAIWNFVMNMDQWSSLTFILSLFAIAGGLALVGIIAGSTFGFKTDFIILAQAIAGFITIGAVFTQFASIVKSELTSRIFVGCTGSCAPANFIVAITVGLLAFYYVWTVIEWWRGKDY